MEEQLPYRAEYAKTGRAKCKGCKMGISAEELRVAAMVQSPFHDGKQANWYHSECFFVKQRPKCTSEIAYFFSLKYDDQQKLKAQIESNGVLSTSTGSESTGKGKKRLKPSDALKDFGIEYSKTSRAECRACQQKIIKGEIRIKKVSFETEAGRKYGGQALWHHVECFEKIRDELLYSECGDKLPGFKSLNKNDQEMVKNTIQLKTEAPEVKKIKVEDKDPEQIAKELEFDAMMKKQNDEFYKYRSELQQLLKHELYELITQNHQKMPDGTSDVKALDLAADLLTFGRPEKCTECKNGMLTLGNNTYVCNGALDEWAKCTNKTQDPLRTITIIPKDLMENYQFLKSYKGKISKRLFQTVVPVLATSVIKDESTDETDKPKIEREKPKLYQMTFLIVGKTQTKLGDLKKIITQFGGEVKTKLTDKITAVISNKEEINKMNIRMQNVRDCNLPVISEDFFTKLNKNSDTIQLMEEFCISSWTDILSTVPDKVDEKNEKTKHKSGILKSAEKSSKVTMKVKGGGAVDPDSKLDSVAHIYSKDGLKFNSILSLADLQTGQNSFYKIQVLQGDINQNQFWLFRSWGRIGTTVGGNKVDSYYDADSAVSKFKDLYLEKSNNVFGAANFKKYPGYYNPIDVEFEAIENKFAKVCETPSKLDEPIQNLIKLMFDVNLMQQTMIQFEIDTEKMPLGKLSKSQIEKALIALNDLTVLIDRGAKESEFISPTNRFYTLIPHNFGMKAPTLLNSTEIIKQKIEMLESLMEIELAYSMLNDSNINEALNPIDAHYAQLKTDMEVLDPNSDEFKTLQLYVTNTHATTHNAYGLEIQNVYKIRREGESERFDKFKNLPNRKLLWHGSRLTNYVGILKNGLRIAPPEAPCTGYMFGKGIYFADMVSKSANYCFTSPANNTGLMLLCDVALGNMQEYATSHYVTKLPNGKHSTKGVGGTYPDPKGSIKQGDFEIPCGLPVKTNTSSYLLYNEYIIYDIEQVNVKYLLNMRFKYKPLFYPQ